MSLKANFRKAAYTPAKRTEMLQDLQKGFEQKMNEGGLSAIKADGIFQMRAASLIREVVLDEYTDLTPMPILVERKNAKLGDKHEYVRLVGRNRVVRYTPGTHPLVYTAQRAKSTIATGQYEIAWGVPLFEIMEGQMTIEEVTRYGAAAIVRHEVEMIFGGVNAALSVSAKDIYGDALRTNLAGDLTQGALDAAIERMSRYNSGLKIWGTHKSLNKIFGFIGASSEALKTEYVQRGSFGQYKGCSLHKVEFDYDPYSESMPTFDGISFDNAVLITAEERGAVVLERDISLLDWEELDTEKGHFRVGKRFDKGVHVAEPHRFHMIQLNVV